MPLTPITPTRTRSLAPMTWGAVRVVAAATSRVAPMTVLAATTLEAVVLRKSRLETVWLSSVMSHLLVGIREDRGVGRQRRLGGGAGLGRPAWGRGAGTDAHGERLEREDQRGFLRFERPVLAGLLTCLQQFRGVGDHRDAGLV